MIIKITDMSIILENEKLSANELVLLIGLVERLKNECMIEERTQSDIRLAINYCMENRMREQKGK